MIGQLNDHLDRDEKHEQERESVKEAQDEEERQLNWFEHYLDDSVAVQTINYMKSRMMPIFFELSKRLKEFARTPSPPRFED